MYINSYNDTDGSLCKATEHNVSPSYNIFKFHQRTEGLTTLLQGCATLSFQQA